MTEDSVHKLSIKEWAEEDRPREKLMERGEEALTNAELLAILIGSGTPKKSAVELMQEVLRSCGNRLSRLSRMSVEELMSFNGIGVAKAITLKAAAEIGRRRAVEDVAEVERFSDSSQIYAYMLPLMRDLPHEECWVLLLNNNARLLKKVRISTGGLTNTLVDVRMIMKEAILADATMLVLVHNHPSGSPRPSNDDNRLTDAVDKAAQTMNLKLLDHVVVAEGGFYSYCDEGKL
jgi:DNA repair protein RadC